MRRHYIDVGDRATVGGGVIDASMRSNAADLSPAGAMAGIVAGLPARERVFRWIETERDEQLFIDRWWEAES